MEYDEYEKKYQKSYKKEDIVNLAGKKLRLIHDLFFKKGKDKNGNYRKQIYKRKIIYRKISDNGLTVMIMPRKNVRKKYIIFWYKFWFNR